MRIVEIGQIKRDNTCDNCGTEFIPPRDAKEGDHKECLYCGETMWVFTGGRWGNYPITPIEEEGFW